MNAAIAYLSEACLGVTRVGASAEANSSPNGGTITAAACVGADGLPTNAAATVLEKALDDAECAAASLTLVLPARVVRSRRISISVPVNGFVSHGHLREASRRLDDLIAEERAAILYRQPTAYYLDGVPVDAADPTGAHGDSLRIDVLVMSAPLVSLAAFERCVGGAGATLTDVVTPHIALPAATLGNHCTGIVVNIDHGTLVFSVVHEQTVLACSSTSCGYRHLVSDVRAACHVSVGEAKDRVEALLASSGSTQGTALEAAAAAIDARLDEMAHWVRSQMALSNTAGLIIATGETARAPRLRQRWAAAGLSLAQPPAETGGETAERCLAGAARILSGGFGLHEPATASLPGARSHGQRVWQWLRDHF